MNIIDRFSTHLREVLVGSVRIATDLKNPSVEPIHLLLALSMQKGSVANEILNRYKLDTKNIEKIIAELKPEINLTTKIDPSPFSANSKSALEKALVIAQKNSHNYLGTEHLLSALLNLNDSSIEELLTGNKVKKTELNEQLEIVLATASQFPQITEIPEVISHMQEGLSDDAMLQQILPTDKKNKKKESALNFFAANLTNPDIQADIDPVIGRETEIERMMQILCRRTKNNPILLGEPGVGKTAIVEGLAKKIAAGEVPDALLNKKIYALDMGMLIAGTAYRGEFEGRLRQVIEDVSSDPNIILFIDELHNIVGAGSNQGTMDAANILKPALARGEIRCIGATTPAEFKKHIESDAALERRFQPIYVKEPSVADTIKILSGIKSNYEIFHNLKITDQAIAKTVQLADRYITNKLLPDKAIDLLDETAAAKRLKTKPTLAEAKLWRLKQELEKTISAKEVAAGNDKFNEAVRLKEKEKILEQEIKYYKEKTALQKTAKTETVITEEDIINQLAKIIDTPIRDLFIKKQGRASMDAARHDSAESNNLINFESELQKRIIGQDEVLHEVAQIIQQAQLELSSPNRPLASFLFVGESGVGKTELAKSLAQTLYPNQNSFIQLNMSEFNESFSVSKLLGSPAGYIGYKESNQFTDRIKMNPYCVVLLDEIDKAHKDVTKLLLQMLENGEITDSVGKKISLKHAVIILTTSLGGEEMKKNNIGFENNNNNSENKKRIKEKLKEFFSPELINRLDQICIFNNLTKADLAKIAALEIIDLNKQLEQYHTAIKAEDKIFDWFVGQLTEKNNAREVRRQIRNQVEKMMAEIIMQDKIKTQHKLVLQQNKLSVK
ncbi:MAG TPA: ATP-dependent Clp protease ATP-binding subunit [Candidatus Udaeobacter sp.]|nr:ATP-dependent Clp protease ATP-binding subunit [Candidatus Udaeobacter sp.]